MGRTSVHLVGNVFRLSSMGFAITLLMDGQGVEGLALSVLLGELTSTAVAGLWLMFTGQRQSWPVLPAAILTGLFIFLSEPLTVYTREISPTLRLAVVAGTAALISLGAAIVFRRRIAGFVNGFIR